ncbi:hypothetical protein FKP32DRAFT_1586888 [Trametes sanguinea]|nr:hypothetical protein FKP32DRAFT_1596092 [Trametes sanguinea]KAI9066865.1 hypothetical protein FKP32DRAFT_1589245 [Trametes sanguinea]KAI9069495.1 hypothetical protein FKP32DRAFT_1586888 [Trametes sanguinea]
MAIPPSYHICKYPLLIATDGVTEALAPERVLRASRRASGISGAVGHLGQQPPGA